MADDLLLINDELDKLDKEILEKGQAMEKAKIELDQAELEYDIAIQSCLLEAKNAGDSDSKAKAKAFMGAVDKTRARLIADSKHRQAKILLDNMTNQRDSMKEKAYNIRASMKAFGG